MKSRFKLNANRTELERLHHAELMSISEMAKYFGPPIQFIHVHNLMKHYGITIRGVKEANQIKNQKASLNCSKCGQPRPSEGFKRGRVCAECAQKCDQAKYLRKREVLLRQTHERYHRDDKVRTRVRNYKRFYYYGVTEAQYNAMLVAQNYSCAICRTTDTSPYKHFGVDHAHDSGLIRGLLCSRCNLALGYLKDSKDTALAAAAYLEKYDTIP